RSLAKCYCLRLRRIVGIHRVNFGRGLAGHMRVCARSERNLARKAGALQKTPGCGDHEYMSEARHAVIAIERALGHIRRATVKVREDRLLAAQFEAETQEARLANGAAFHLRRFVLKRRKFRSRCTECLGGLPGRGGRQRHAGLFLGTSRSTSKDCTMRSASQGIPSPVFQLVNRNGFLPRMSCESLFITSRLAPTCGARSVLFITRKSHRGNTTPVLREL